MWGSGCCVALRNKAGVPLAVEGAEPRSYPEGCALGICFTPSASQAGPLTFLLAFISAFLSDSLPAQWLCRQLSLPRGSQKRGMEAFMGRRGREDSQQRRYIIGFLDVVLFSKYFERVCSELVLGPAAGETESTDLVLGEILSNGGDFLGEGGGMHSSVSSA